MGHGSGCMGIGPPCAEFENNYFTEMCSGSEAGSYLRLIDSLYHSTLGLRVMQKKKDLPDRRGSEVEKGTVGLLAQCNSIGRIEVGEREFFIDNLLVRIHVIIAMIRWTGLAPWEFEFPVPGRLKSTFLISTLDPQLREGLQNRSDNRPRPPP